MRLVRRAVVAVAIPHGLALAWRFIVGAPRLAFGLLRDQYGDVTGIAVGGRHFVGVFVPTFTAAGARSRDGKRGGGKDNGGNQQVHGRTS